MGIAFRISTAKNSENADHNNTWQLRCSCLAKSIHAKKGSWPFLKNVKKLEKTPTAFRSFCPVEGKNMDNDGDKTIRLS